MNSGSRVDQNTSRSLKSKSLSFRLKDMTSRAMVKQREMLVSDKHDALVLSDSRFYPAEINGDDNGFSLMLQCDIQQKEKLSLCETICYNLIPIIHRDLNAFWKGPKINLPSYPPILPSEAAHQ